MRTVIVLGDLNLDLILAGMTEPPEFGREILASRRSSGLGGSAANTAAMLAANGCAVRLFAQVGVDVEGDFLVAMLAGLGIDVATIARSNEHATGLTVSLTYPEDRMYVSDLGAVAATRLEDLQPGYILPEAHLHLTSYFLQRGLRPSVGPLLEAAKEAGMTTSLDPGGDPTGEWDVSALAPYFRRLDWFLPNADEIRAVTGCDDTETALREFPREVGGVVVKAGADGAISRCGGEIVRHPGFAAEVVDTTGAGDCFGAGFLCALAGGAPLAEAVRLGNRFGAESVSRVGLPL